MSGYAYLMFLATVGKIVLAVLVTTTVILWLSNNIGLDTLIITLGLALGALEQLFDLCYRLKEVEKLSRS